MIPRRVFPLVFLLFAVTVTQSIVATMKVTDLRESISRLHHETGSSAETGRAANPGSSSPASRRTRGTPPPHRW